ncbi:MAG TPA: LacI family DNA-binding transcriptional regulator [Mycobacteriales bacterium]
MADVTDTSPPSGRRPTLRDVAARAQVSFKTVSRVVNNEPGVSPVLAARVRTAIDELRFEPNAGARSLRRSDGRTASIGLLLEDVANPYAASVQRAVEDEARPRGVMVFSGSLDEDPTRERELVRAFTARRADGLLLMPASADQGYLERELRAGTAIVCIDREARGLAVDSVITTNMAGAAEATRHLAAAGHRRIAYLGDRPGIPTAEQRYQGYRSALEGLGIPVDPALVVQGPHDVASADGTATALLTGPTPPTALFAAQNLITIGAITALRRLGLERRVAVVGFDDFPMADLLAPAVTVVAQDPAAIGRLAAKLLFARIDGVAGTPTTHVVPSTLIRRGSGEIPAA